MNDSSEIRHPPGERGEISPTLVHTETGRGIGTEVGFEEVASFISIVDTAEIGSSPPLGRCRAGRADESFIGAQFVQWSSQIDIRIGNGKALAVIFLCGISEQCAQIVVFLDGGMIAYQYFGTLTPGARACIGNGSVLQCAFADTLVGHVVPITILAAIGRLVGKCRRIVECTFDVEAFIRSDNSVN